MFEFAKVLGERQEQLERGDPPRVPLRDMTTAYEIAHEEFLQGVLPVNVVRLNKDDVYEERDVTNMIFVE